MRLRALARRLPSPVYRGLQRLYRRLRPVSPVPVINPGPLLTRTAPRLAGIPGWMNLDDLAHFTLVLQTQTAAGLHGHLLEIGCYHGRSAAAMAMQLQPGERLWLVDAFDLPGTERYGDRPSPEAVRANLARAAPSLTPDRVEIIYADSRSLSLPSGLRLRFAHIDGGHEPDTVLADLATCAAHLLPAGILAVDDYAHPQYPGVTAAVDAFLKARPQWRIVADLNRGGALGRKLYLHRRTA